MNIDDGDKRVSEILRNPETYRRYLKILKNELPAMWQSIAGHRASLPTDLVEEYVRQDLDQEHMFLRLLSYRCEFLKTKGAMVDGDPHFILPISRWLKYDAPSYFSERQMGEAFLNTTILPDLRAADLAWRFPTFKIYVPQGLLPIEGTDKCFGQY